MNDISQNYAELVLLYRYSVLLIILTEVVHVTDCYIASEIMHLSVAKQVLFTPSLCD